MSTAGVRRGAWAGAVAGIACVAAMEVLARLVGLQTLPALLQDPLLSIMPGPVFGFLIDTLQHWGKVVEEAGLLVTMVVFLAALGAAAARLARWRADVQAGMVAGAAAWLVVMVALLPVAGSGLFGLADGVEPLVLWALVFAVYAFVWEWLARSPATTEVDPGRRRLLVALPAGVAAGSLALVGVLRVPEWVRSAVTPPEAA